MNRPLERTMATLTDTVPLFAGRESQQSSTPTRGRRPSCTENATRFPADARQHSCKSAHDGLSLLSLIKLAGAAFALFLPALHAAHAQVPVKVVRFDDVTPPGVALTMTFNAIGTDPQERVYITLCNATPIAISSDTIPRP